MAINQAKAILCGSAPDPLAIVNMGRFQDTMMRYGGADAHEAANQISRLLDTGLFRDTLGNSQGRLQSHRELQLPSGTNDAPSQSAGTRDHTTSGSLDLEVTQSFKCLSKTPPIISFLIIRIKDPNLERDLLYYVCFSHNISGPSPTCHHSRRGPSRNLPDNITPTGG